MGGRVINRAYPDYFFTNRVDCIYYVDNKELQYIPHVQSLRLGPFKIDKINPLFPETVSLSNITCPLPKGGICLAVTVG